jgi:tRNA (guanosine-2'-O-)-methyltransferase
VLFFGTERDGLSEEILNRADGFLKILMVGFTESLNISVSAATIIQNLTSRLRNSTIGMVRRGDSVKAWLGAKSSIKDIKRIEALF